MSKPEFFYRSVSSIEVPGFVIDMIGNDRVTPIQSPFRDGFKHSLSRIITSYRKSKSVPELVQISPTHGRSFEIRYGKEGFIFWEDEHGIVYGSHRLKGVNVIDPDVRIEKRAPSGFLIWGIQDSDSILRTVRASNLMRSNQIDTEAIVYLFEPAQLQFRGERVSTEEYKTRLIQRVWQDNHRDLKKDRNPDAWKPATRKDIPALSKELGEMTFYETASAMQVGERFLDLKQVFSQDELKKIMKRVFTFVNTRNTRWYNSGRTDIKEILDTENPKDIMRYFGTLLPTWLAGNYGKLHKINLLHIHPHLGNVSLVGSIYDVDSVVGEPLGFGDEAVTEKEILDEVKYMLFGANFRHANGIIHLLKELEDQEILPEGVSKSFINVFVIEYVKERGWMGNGAANLQQIKDFLEVAEIDLDSEDQTIREYLVSTLGEDVVDSMIKSRIEDMENNPFRRYLLPVVVDPESILPPTENQELPEEIAVNEPMSDERRNEVLNLTMKLLLLHQSHIASTPGAGKDYFAFNKVPEYVLGAHNQLSNQDVADIMRLWVNSEVKDQFIDSKYFLPRSVGSFLLALTQINTRQVTEAFKDIMPHIEETEFNIKLARLNDFFELLPPGTLTEDFRTYLYEIFDKHKAFNVERELEVRSGLNLFTYGIITERFTNLVFNRHNLGILLNEFKPEHLLALQAALHCPELMDPLNSHYPEGALHNLRLALTGIMVRNGQLENPPLMEDQTEEREKSRSAYLQYFFASVDKNTIADPILKEALTTPISKDWVIFMIKHLLIAGGDLHPNSYLASSLREAKLEANDVVEILKISLEMLNGDMSELNPTIKAVLEKPVKGIIKKENASELVMACIAFGIDLPQIIEPFLTVERNRSAFMDFLSDEKMVRESGIYEALGSSYSINPMYKFMSTGVSALPGKVRALFEQAEGNPRVVNTLVTRILESLFTDDHGYSGYFRCFFGGMIGGEGFPPQPDFGLNDFGAVRINGKVKWQLWRIVHPDIWNIVALADTKILVNFIKTKLPEGTVLMGMGPRNGMLGRRQSPLSECLPPYLYEKVSPSV